MTQTHLVEAVGAAGFRRRAVMRRPHERAWSHREVTQALLDDSAVGVELDHPNHASLIEVGELDGLMFLVREYVEGHSLAEVLAASASRSMPVPLASALRITGEVLRGLHVLHTLDCKRGPPPPLTHGSLSPHNVLLGSNGEVKLSDPFVSRFKVSGLIEPRGPAEQRRGPWRSPEEARGARTSVASNLFTVGGLLYAMVCGRGPFAGDADDLTRAISRADFRPAHQVNPSLPEPVAKLISRAMAPDEQQRPPSAHDLELDVRIAARICEAEEDRDRLRAWLGALFRVEPAPGK